MAEPTAEAAAWEPSNHGAAWQPTSAEALSRTAVTGYPKSRPDWVVEQLLAFFGEEPV
jgi:hypothetical protein